MKSIALTVIVACFLLTSGCEKRSADQHDSHDMTEDSPNQALYDKVMDVHDEVMPKMNDLHEAKTALQTRLKLPGLPEHERQEITYTIAKIDSASETMMVWMRQFEPVSDTAVGADSARAYLEKELVKVKEVRENILQALEAAQ